MVEGELSEVKIAFFDQVLFLGLCAVLLAVLSACVDEVEGHQERIYVSETLPESPYAGGTLSIIGGGFGIEGLFDRVYLSEEPLEILYWTHDRIDCRLPPSLSGERVLLVQSDEFVTAPHHLFIKEPLHSSAADLGELTP